MKSRKLIDQNYHTFEQDEELKNASGNVFGRAITRYEIYKRLDVTNLESVLGYLVLMKHRVIIPNQSVQAPGPSSTTSYENYPAILFNKVDISANNSAEIRLQSIFPKTLNSAVNTSSNTSGGSSSTSIEQSSSGSTNTNVNTFGVSVGGGAFGDIPMFNLALDYSHSWENSTMNSNTYGSTTGRQSSHGAGDSMSIKDWSSYGYLDLDSVSPRWLWGQSFPWDVIQFNQTSNGSTINLPTFIQDRLKDGSIVLPPSQLSMFGTDFSMQAGWLIDFPTVITSDESVTIKHTIESFTASHSLSSGTISASLQSTASANSASIDTSSIDLSTFALKPIANGSSGSAIGFTANPFTIAPTSASSNFKIVSSANNLEVSGKGFDSPMTSSFSTNPSMTVKFKIADVSVDYSLILMHWIGASSGACKMTWKVNNEHTGVIYIDSVEGDGGQNNMSKVELRNTDFTSINFHDYLIIGTNTITLEVEPVDTSASNMYTLFAMAIGEA